MAFTRFLEFYDCVVDTLYEVAEDRSVPPDASSKARGQISHLKRFETVFGMGVCETVFSPTELFAKTLQKPGISAGEVLHGYRLLQGKIEHLRTDESFDELYRATETRVESLQTEIDPPKAPRVTRPPRRLEQCCNVTPGAALDAKSSLRRQYFETVDIIANELERRFDQPDLRKLEDLEKLMSDAAMTPERARSALGVTWRKKWRRQCRGH